MEHFSSIIINQIQHAGYIAVFMLMTLESALIPIPSEITMPFAGFLAQQGHLSFILVVFIGALGNLIGSLIAYAIGFFLEENILLKLIDKYGKYILLRKHEYDRALHWFKKYGNSVVFFSRLLPAVRTFISLPAGLAGMNIWKFSFYTFIGSFFWSLLLTYIGFYLGKNWQSIHGIFNNIHYVIVGALILLVLWYINKKKQFIKFPKTPEKK